MAKVVGLSRKVKLEWLNQTANLVMEGKPELDVKEELNDYLQFEIESQTVIRKTREILMHIWFYENDYMQKLRPMALNLLGKYPEYALEIHWCMMLASYPIFGDVCNLLRKMSVFQEEITLSQLKQKIFDDWGERTTLYHSIDKMIATLKDFGVLTCEKPGHYHIRFYEVMETKISSFMLYSALITDRIESFGFPQANNLACFFPFKYEIKKEELLQDGRFVMRNLGGEMMISLKS